MKYANWEFYSAGFTDYQRMLLIALIDHESAGSWDPAIVGDAGCSIGIAQWNWCAGNIASDGYEAQVAQLIESFQRRFETWNNDLQAIGKHNWPARDYNTEYINKVLSSADQLYLVN